MVDPPAAVPRADILIVDDTLENLRLLSDLLTQHSYKVRKVSEGQLALKAAYLRPPDLILLDIMMPEIDGYEICRQLKANEATRDIPVIFLSARDDGLDKVQAFAVGGVDYITKPFQLVEVLARVENQLKMNRLQQQVSDQNQRLQVQNAQLHQEMGVRKAVEAKLQVLNQELESRIAARTAELAERNQDLLELHDQLQQALVQEQVLNTLKSELITTISHEFRTPLTVISTTAELLQRNVRLGNFSQTDRHFQGIKMSVQRINQVLNDALLLADGQAGNLTYEPAPVPLRQFCQTLIEQWKLPDNSLHRLSFECSGPVPQLLDLDQHLLKLILTHLLQNALRFSPQGGLIQLRLINQGDRIQFQVQDSGIGIPSTEQAQVFQRFYRASNANLIPGMPGAGLGLAVVKLAVELHQGTITLQSEVNAGTTVTVTLPIKPLRSLPRAQPEPPDHP